MEQKYARYLLDKTQTDYNRIAEHFSKTRAHIWKDLNCFDKFVERGDRVLDMGCGNGRLVELFKHKRIEYVGIDNSEKLIRQARKKLNTLGPRIQDIGKVRFVKGSALNLHFENNYFDKIFSIAVFHHIPSKNFRLQFLKEAKRVLKPDGLLILTVWNLRQKKFLRYHLKYLFLKLIGKSKLDFCDIFYPWKSPKGKVLAKRYVHCFRKKELGALLKKTGFRIQRIGFLGKHKKNIYCVASRPRLKNE